MSRETIARYRPAPTEPAEAAKAVSLAAVAEELRLACLPGMTEAAKAAARHVAEAAVEAADQFTPPLRFIVEPDPAAADQTPEISAELQANMRQRILELEEELAQCKGGRKRGKNKKT